MTFLFYRLVEIVNVHVDASAGSHSIMRAQKKTQNTMWAWPFDPWN